MNKAIVICLMLSGIIFLYRHSMPDRPDTYVVFAHAINLNPELTTALTNRLQQNHVSYQLDASGNVFVLESHLGKAVTCCS